MKSITFKYLLDGKEMQKIDNMFDNENFTFKIDGDKVFFTTVSSPVSKFFSAEKEEKQRWKDKEQESINNFVRFVENATQPPHLKFTKNRCNGQCFCDGSCKYNPIKNLEKLKNNAIDYTKVPKNLMDIISIFQAETEVEVLNIIKSVQKKHLINSQPAQNVQEALKRAEQYQAKNGREESLETERFGNFLLDEDEDFNWCFDKLTTEERKVISDLERKPFYGKGLLEDKVTPYDTTSTIKEKTGVKHSEGKLFYELDFNFIRQLAERMQQNKENSKYALWNWKKRMTDEDIENLKQALLRHVLAVMEGEYEDDGRPFGHLESISNNAMMINYQLKQK